MATFNLMRFGAQRLLPTSGCLVRNTQMFGPERICAQLSTSETLNKRLYGPASGLPSFVGHWKIERVITAVILPCVPLAILLAPNLALDSVASLALITHCHQGLDGMAQDYIHGEVLPKIASVFMKIATILALAGMFMLNYNNVGFGMGVRTLFKQ